MRIPLLMNKELPVVLPESYQTAVLVFLLNLCSKEANDYE